LLARFSVSYRIVVPLDGSGFGEHALPAALALATRTHGTLHLVTVAILQSESPASPRDIPGEASIDRGMHHAERYLQDVAARIRASGFEGPVHQEVIPPGNAARTLVRHLAEIEADLVIMTTHGRGPLQRAWLGSTTDGVIRRSPCPVLILRPPAQDEGAPLDPVDLGLRPDLLRTLVVPLDGSEAAERGMDPLTTLLRGADPAELHLVRVVPPFISAGSPYLPMAIREMQEHELVDEAATGYLERVASRIQVPDARVRTHVVMAGQPVTAILDVAEAERATLIAMSSSGRGGTARLLLGSVADKVVRGASCPVLLSRNPEDA
jgi:nucleotide-binding universal stress UspA family protein